MECKKFLTNLILQNSELNFGDFLDYVKNYQGQKNQNIYAISNIFYKAKRFYSTTAEFNPVYELTKLNVKNFLMRLDDVWDRDDDDTQDFVKYITRYFYN